MKTNKKPTPKTATKPALTLTIRLDSAEAEIVDEVKNRGNHKSHAAAFKSLALQNSVAENCISIMENGLVHLENMLIHHEAYINNQLAENEIRMDRMTKSIESIMEQSLIDVSERKKLIDSITQLTSGIRALTTSAFKPGLDGSPALRTQTTALSSNQTPALQERLRSRSPKV